jgi:signal transduction histidine kinase
MEIAQEPVEEAPEAQRTSENPLVRAVARIPLPLGAKLLIGFAVVAALLAIGYVLGVVALGQSNSRGEELLRLQRRAVYLQVVLTDTSQLRNAIDFRLNAPGSRTAFGSGLDGAITNDYTQLCNDSGLSCMGFEHPVAPFDLAAVDHSAYRKLTNALSLFYVISGNTAPPIPTGATVADPVERTLRQADRFAAALAADVGKTAHTTRARANELVAANRSSFTSSRNLLIGMGTGSLVLALALGLLLSWSVVGPLRRTEDRLDEIGAGNFSGRLEVANRDEIGSLAAKVNSTSDQLERVQRQLELASEHKSQFLANMSHELRTPLNAIIGFSEVLREQMFGDLNERQLAYVDDVLEAGRHLLSLINDVLDLAKIEAGRMDLALSQVEIPELLRSAVSMHSERAGRGGVHLGLATEPAEITVTADDRRLRQIVFNLLSNAVKFTPADGRVDVSAHLDDGRVEIAVADTGPGIAREDLDTIFEEFEQASDGKQAEGTGLGLPLSRKLVELHGGRLWVESEVGKGSTFRFTIPVRGPVKQEVS